MSKRVTQKLVCYITQYTSEQVSASQLRLSNFKAYDVWRLELLSAQGRCLYTDTVEVPTGGPAPPVDLFLERARRNAVQSLIALEAQP